MAKFKIYAVVLAITAQCFVQANPAPDNYDNRYDSSQVRSSSYQDEYKKIMQKQRTSSQIECYVCSDCANVDSSTQRKRCPWTANYEKQGKCISYGVESNKSQNIQWTRGCPQERGSCSDIIHGIKLYENMVKIVKCIECEGNLCNGAFSFNPSFAILSSIALSSLLATLIQF